MILPIEKQVTSLELSKRAKKLGFPQDGCQWYWNPGMTNNKVWYELLREPYNYGSPNKLPKGIVAIAAPTVAEWGVMLIKGKCWSYFDEEKSEWICCNDIDWGKSKITKEDRGKYAKTEADARAKMWEHLKVNKLLEVKG